MVCVRVPKLDLAFPLAMMVSHAFILQNTVFGEPLVCQKGYYNAREHTKHARTVFVMWPEGLLLSVRRILTLSTTGSDKLNKYRRKR